VLPKRPLSPLLLPSLLPRTLSLEDTYLELMRLLGKEAEAKEVLKKKGGEAKAWREGGLRYAQDSYKIQSASAAYWVRFLVQRSRAITL
jgi:hypothetical protein